MTREKLVEIIGVDKGYFISNMGSVVSMKTGVKVYLKLHESHGGYLCCTPMLNNKSKTIKVAREVAKSFVPNPYDKPEVNHIDGNKHNNSAVNLEWVTRSENQRHSYLNRLTSEMGASHHNAKLTEEKVIEMRKLSNKGISRNDLARMFNIHFGTVSKVVMGTSWKHVAKPDSLIFREQEGK